MPGNFPSPFFLAPMAELSTPALRRLISDFSDRVVFHSEMLSAAAIVSGGFHDGAMAVRCDFDTALVFQIAGNDPAVMAEACRRLADRGPYGININMSCPVSRIVKKGWGAALLREPLQAARIVKACRSVAGVPISVKMRSGFEHDDPEKMMAFADMLREEGADYIILHPRFAKLYYSRAARWELVKQLKEHIGIPVIGNGDIVSPEGAHQRMREAGCDGIMIGRGAVQFPWIFSTCRQYFNEGLYDVTVDVRDCFLRALDYIEQYLPPHLWKSRTHRFCQYFSQNVFHAHSLFSSIRVCENMGAIRKIIISYYERNPHEAIKRLTGSNTTCAS